MHSKNLKSIYAILFIMLPALTWLYVVQATEELYTPRYLALLELIQLTPEKPWLLGALFIGIFIATLIVLLVSKCLRSEFGGAPFRTFVRGTKIVSGFKLNRLTKTKKMQISLAGVSVPEKVEPLHVLINGATGTGKSVLLRELVASALSRGDRMVIVDPNGDMLSRFGTEKDCILNPYDQRTEGWSFFNEIQNE